VKGETCIQYLGACPDQPSCASPHNGMMVLGLVISGNCYCNYICGGKPGRSAPKRSCEAF
jgi:hypothetical protein